MSLYDYLLILTSGLAVLMALGLLMRPFQYRNIIFSLILISIAQFNLGIYLLIRDSIWNYPILIFLRIPIPLLLGPLIYFYILSHTRDKDILHIKDWFHFLPTFFVVLILMFYMNQDVFDQLRVRHGIFNSKGLLLYDVADFFSIGYIMAYIIFSIVTIIGRIKSGNPIYNKILIFLIILIISLIIPVVAIIAMITQSNSIYRIIGLMVSIIIILIFLLNQRYPYLLQHGTIGINKKREPKSHLSNIDLRNLNKQLNIIMEKEKFYCDEDLTLKRLSDALEVTPHQLSEFLNEHHNKNFNNFINTYRINEAKILLSEDPNRNALSIAYATGFNSYSAFHSAFKKETGMSPADFRKSKNNNNK
jgi:AraC-like DNA-binding protein